MSGMDLLDFLFAASAVFFHSVLIVHFALRKRRFEAYVMKYRWMVYALALPSSLVSFVLL